MAGSKPVENKQATETKIIGGELMVNFKRDIKRKTTSIVASGALVFGAVYGDRAPAAL